MLSAFLVLVFVHPDFYAIYREAAESLEKVFLYDEVKEVWCKAAVAFLEHKNRDGCDRAHMSAVVAYRNAGLEDKAREVLLEKAEELREDRNFFEASRIYDELGLANKVDEAWIEIREAFFSRRLDISPYYIREKRD